MRNPVSKFDVSLYPSDPSHQNKPSTRKRSSKKDHENSDGQKMFIKRKTSKKFMRRCGNASFSMTNFEFVRIEAAPDRCVNQGVERNAIQRHTFAASSEETSTQPAVLSAHAAKCSATKHHEVAVG